MLLQVATCSALVSLLLLNCLQYSQAFEIPDHVKKQVKKLHKHCVNQTGVDEALFMQVGNDKMPSDQSFKCFVHCMFDIFGLIDSANVMHLENLAEILPEEMAAKVLNLVKECGTQAGAEACDIAYNTAMCYLKTDPEFVMGAVMSAA